MFVGAFDCSPRFEAEEEGNEMARGKQKKKNVN